MLESIYIGMTGLVGYSQGLRVIANNTANLNTPGFKGSSLQFGDLVYAQGPGPGGGGLAPNVGQGLNTYATSFDFSAGELRQTGNDLDLAIDGEGLFSLRTADGDVRYTRDGEFVFDNDGVLVSRTNGATVLSRDERGQLVPISLDGHRSLAGQATGTVNFRGNLSTTDQDKSESVTLTVLDATGGEHELTVTFADQSATTAGLWKLTVLEGSTPVAEGTLQFKDGQLPSGGSSFKFTYRPAQQSEMPLVLSFGEDVTSYAAGDSSTLAVSRQDGYAAGSLTSASFDADGVLQLGYSNGKTSTGASLALARFESADAVAATGDNLFRPVDANAWSFGTARSGPFGAIRSGVVELSNVDLSSQFSDLVIMQRGYQASSQIVSTANDMLQELFSMRGR